MNFLAAHFWWRVHWWKWFILEDPTCIDLGSDENHRLARERYFAREPKLKDFL